MKTRLGLALSFAIAAAGPAAAHHNLGHGDYFKNLPGVGLQYEAPLRRDFREQTRDCTLRDVARMDLGNGFSIGLGGGLKDPTITLRWRKSLQPHLERRDQRGCGLFAPGAGLGG